MIYSFLTGIFYKKYYHNFLFDDLFNFRYLLPNVSIRIELRKANNNFFMLGAKEKGDKVKLDISKLELQLRTVRSEAALSSHFSSLLNRKAIYPLLESSVNFVSIAANQTKIYINSICQGFLPTMLFIGLVDNTASSGAIEMNPFVFSHHNLQSIQFFVSGKPYPNRKLTFDWDTGDYLEAYHDFISLIGLDSSSDTKITPEEFKNLYCFYGLDLTGDRCVNSHYHKSAENRGIISAELVSFIYNLKKIRPKYKTLILDIQNGTYKNFASRLLPDK